MSFAGVAAMLREILEGEDHTSIVQLEEENKKIRKRLNEVVANVSKKLGDIEDKFVQENKKIREENERLSEKLGDLEDKFELINSYLEHKEAFIEK